MTDTFDKEFLAGEEKPQTTKRAIFEWTGLLAGALIVAILLRLFVLQAFHIPSPSMVPTLKVGDRVLVNKLSYKFGDPGRGDIVVFEAPPVEKAKGINDLVKRIVGLPGETIEGRNGSIFIDGKRLDEKYLPDEVESKTFGPIDVPANSYYMLGDNRGQSQDSTFFGPIKRSQIVGRVFLRYWPLTRLKIWF